MAVDKEYQYRFVPQMYLDEFKKLLEFIGQNYDWGAHRHLVFIDNIGSATVTDKYKSKKGDKHQVFNDITLRILYTIPREKKEELEKIIS